MCRCVVLGLPFLVFLLTAGSSVGENAALPLLVNACSDFLEDMP